MPLSCCEPSVTSSGGHLDAASGDEALNSCIKELKEGNWVGTDAGPLKRSRSVGALFTLLCVGRGERLGVEADSGFRRKGACSGAGPASDDSA